MQIKIGCHVSGAGGLWSAPINANELGCETFQIFSRSPQGGPVKPIEADKKDPIQMGLRMFELQNQ